jgi:hypothetical protein
MDGNFLNALRDLKSYIQGQRGSRIYKSKAIQEHMTDICRIPER